MAAICLPFGWFALYDRLQIDNPFHTWHNIRSMDECWKLHLKYIISRLEFVKSDLINTGHQDNILVGSSYYQITCY